MMADLKRLKWYRVEGLLLSLEVYDGAQGDLIPAAVSDIKAGNVGRFIPYSPFYLCDDIILFSVHDEIGQAAA